MTEDEKLAQLDFTDPAHLRQALKHAMTALAEDNEGVRLWMLDCGELVAKHRARADAAERKLEAMASARIPQPGQVPPDHPDAVKPVGWGEHTRDCDCGDCP